MTTATCARRAGGSGRAAASRTIHVTAPRTSWPHSETCVSIASSAARYAARRPARFTSAAELHVVPGGNGRELEQRPAAVRIAVAEIRGLVVPRDLEEPFLDAVVEPGAPEHELLQPVDERLAADERHAFPVPHQIQAGFRLAPVLVMGLAAAAGMAVFWGRVCCESVRSRRQPRLVAAASLTFVARIAVLTLLGVKLPHE